MKRSLKAAATAMVVAIAMQPSADAVAAGKAKPKAAAATMKACKYKLSTGKVQSWTCDKSQICCASEQFGLFTCGSQLLQCL